MQSIIHTTGTWQGRFCLLLAAAFLLVPAIAFAESPVYVSSPMIIEHSGTYVLIKDILNYDGKKVVNGTTFYEPCIKILASDVIFDGNGHTIQGIFDSSRDDQVGILADVGLERISVKNTKVEGFNEGIWYATNVGGLIEANTVTNNDVGIALTGAREIVVRKNTAQTNRMDGILVIESDACEVTQNTVSNNAKHGISVILSGIGGAQEGNLIEENTADSNAMSGITLFMSGLQTVSKNNATSNSGSGILLNNSWSQGSSAFSNVISENFVSKNSESGISLESASDYNTVVRNKAEGNTLDGIRVISSSHNTISGNSALRNVNAGVGLLGASKNNISDNEMSDSLYGIEIGYKSDLLLTTSDENEINHNLVVENTQGGIYVHGSDNFNVVTKNLLIKNAVSSNAGRGVILEYAQGNTLTENGIEDHTEAGIWMNGAAGNIIYNNIFNNTHNVAFEQAISENTWNVLNLGTPNVLTGPSIGGNFWAQPDGYGHSQISPDSTGDGFCDESFSIASQNIDNFPLKNHLTASFTASPTEGQAPVFVSFTENSTYAERWYWNFGDGSEVFVGKDPGYHIYWSNATYTVTLTTMNAGGAASAKQNITVGRESPWIYFTGTPRIGAAPLQVFFTAIVYQNLVEPVTYEWDFGDNETSNLKSPSHTYQRIGQYSVNLTVTDQAGTYRASTYESYIEVRTMNPPTADFTAAPRTGKAPMTVFFVDQSISTGPLSYEWDFGDASTSYDKNPSHVYASEGTYEVKLTVTNVGGTDVADFENYITVSKIPAPEAAFTGSPTGGMKPLTVYFTDLSKGNPDQWSWDFGDNTTSGDRNPSHTYSQAGQYTVMLTATNEGGSTTATEENFVTVTDKPVPVAEFVGTPQEGLEPLTVQFTDASSGNPTSWYWEFGDGATSTLTSPIHEYAVPGKYKVRLSVSNGQGTTQKSRTEYIYVKNTPPVAEFNAIPTTGDAPLTVQFTDNSAGAGINKWAWEFGDGGTSVIKNPQYIYNNPGTYSVTLTVGNDGGEDTIQEADLITVLTPTPVDPATLKLVTGWNFASTPRRLAEGHRKAKEVFANVELAGHAILLYDASTKSWKQVMGDDEVRPLDGLWVYAAQPVTVTFVFDPNPSIPPSKQLKKGWNAIGFAGTSGTTARDTLLSLGTAWTNVIGYHDGTVPDDPIIRGSTDPKFSDSVRKMYPTKGYWISMTEDGVLQGMV